jgi:hypothetical protein
MNEELRQAIQSALLRVAENVAKHIIQRDGWDKSDKCFNIDLRAAEDEIMDAIFAQPSVEPEQPVSPEASLVNPETGIGYATSCGATVSQPVSPDPAALAAVERLTKHTDDITSRDSPYWDKVAEWEDYLQMMADVRLVLREVPALRSQLAAEKDANAQVYAAFKSAESQLAQPQGEVLQTITMKPGCPPEFSKFRPPASAEQHPPEPAAEDGGTIPHLQRLLREARSEPRDHPELDATDGAHPAWWRGHEHTTAVFCQEINKILDGKDDGVGVANEPWESTRRRLLELMADVSRFAPLSPADQAKHDSTEYDSEVLTVKIKAALASRSDAEEALKAAHAKLGTTDAMHAAYGTGLPGSHH